MRGKIRKMLFGTRRRLVITSIIGVLAFSGIAFAAWTVITASGSSSAKVGALTAPTITDGDVTTAGDIFPSATSTPTGGLRFKVANPNSGTLYLQSFTVNATSVTGGGTGCDMSIRATGTPAQYFGWAGLGTWFTPAGAAQTVSKSFTGLSIAAPMGDTEVVVPAAIYATDGLVTACQGRSFSGLAITNATFSTAP